MHILVWMLEEQEYALELSAVQQVLLAVDILPLPGGPKEFYGAINLHGDMVPVFSMRSRLGLQEREISENSHFVVCHTAQGRAAFLVDRVLRVAACSPEHVLILEAPLAAHSGIVRSVLKFEGHTIVLLDIKKLVQESVCPA